MATVATHQPPASVIPLPLLPPGQQKLRLRLRHMRFTQELSHLPNDLRALHTLLLQNRSLRTETIYNLVCTYRKLSAIDPAPWPTLGFHSDCEYLAYFDLPDGKTLAGWTVLVQLFEKETFLLLGLDVLNFMVRWVGKYQLSSDLRKADYQEIFNTYSATHPNGFDKESFYATIRSFVEKKYLDNVQPAQLKISSGRLERITTISPNASSSPPPTDGDFAWPLRQCPQCKQKNQDLSTLLSYISSLEETLESYHLPYKRPKRIQRIFSQHDGATS